MKKTNTTLGYLGTEDPDLQQENQNQNVGQEENRIDFDADVRENPQMDNENTVDENSEDEDEDPAPEGVRRNPPRVLRGVNRRYHNEEFVTLTYTEKGVYLVETLNLTHIASLDHDQCNPQDGQLSSIMERMHRETDEYGLMHFWDRLYLATKASSEDNPTPQQAMASLERRGWEEAMVKELDSLEQMEVYDVVPRSESKGRPILDSTWALKRKRFPDGSVRKLKARLCVRGDQQLEGVDFFETYAPVVQWGTVRILLVMSVTLGLVSTQVDYTNAFVQSDIDTLVFVEMPPLYGRDGYIWRLKKSLYGLRQSPLNFFKHLKQGLEDRGWSPSEHDPVSSIKRTSLVSSMWMIVYSSEILMTPSRRKQNF